MQRPTMDPTFIDEAPARPSRRGGMRQVWRLVRAIVGLLLTDLLPWSKRRAMLEEGPPLARFIRGLFYRLAFMPILLVLIVATLVFAGTHPPAVGVEIDPTIDAIYYEPVNFISEDGTRCEAWLVPAVDAKSVVEMKERALARKRPAVLLVHDYGASRQQMLPLVRPLHDAGMVVLAIGARGGGTTLPAAQTFGLTEWMDVKAAVEMLRRRSYVDADRVAVVGVGSGANAALLAARRDRALNVLVLDGPARGANDVLDRYISPRQPLLAWMRPVCKWSFEIAFAIDAEDLELRRFGELMNARHVLMLEHENGASGVFLPLQVEQVETFLRKHLMKDEAAARIGEEP